MRGFRGLDITRYDYGKSDSCMVRALRVVLLSDLHGDMLFGKERRIYDEIVQLQPDLIVVTGDCIDHIHYRQREKVFSLIQKLKECYLLYMVTGNHEYMHKECENFLHRIEAAGTKLLHDEQIMLHMKKRTICLIGVDDPYALYRGRLPHRYRTPRQEFAEHLRDVFAKFPRRTEEQQNRVISVLLSHRPEYLELYADLGVDVVFAGHAHGGQWRLPLFGPVIAPDQGIRPRYTAGQYWAGNTVMFVSRGLGNSVVPIRLFNRPEIVVVDIY